MSKLWISGYYWGVNLSVLPPSKVDFSTMTHVMHFQLGPNSNGTLDETPLSDYQSTNSNPYSAELIYRAQAAGCKALITVGGEGYNKAFQNATTSTNVDKFVANIMAFFTRTRTYNGVTVAYDGIDIDWEPIGKSAVQFQNFVKKLRAALDALNRPVRPLLTAAVTTTYVDASVVNTLAAVQSYLDQINVMTYPYGGSWSVWYVSPLGSSPSIMDIMPAFKAKIPAAKLGFGADFDALKFSGFSAPNSNASSSQSDDQINSTYRQIMASYYKGVPGPTGTVSSGTYVWDAKAQVPYLSAPGPYFISFENETSLQCKVAYAQANGYGGMILWELAGAFRPDMPVGQQNGLMQAVKTAAGLGTMTKESLFKRAYRKVKKLF